jgi:hypothetical protein
MKTLLNFGKQFNLLTPTSRLAIIGGLIVVVSFMMGKSEANSKLEQFNMQYAEFKSNIEKTSIYADSLNKIVIKLADENVKKEFAVKKLKNNIAQRTDQRDTLKKNLLKLETHADSLNKLLEDTTLVVIYKDSIIGNLKGQVVVADSIITDQRGIIVQRDSQALILSKSVTVSTTRADSLQRVLRALPKSPPKPDKIFGFIPKPSRTVVGVTTFVLGVVVGVELTR